MTDRTPLDPTDRRASRRDNFSAATRTTIFKAVGGLCSYPGCGAFTFGATSDGTGILDIGTAAHICAAAEGGPRYDASMSPAERSAAGNGIWMCSDHGRAIDGDVKFYTVEKLRQWKREAELEAFMRVTRHANRALEVTRPASDGLHHAARADLEILRNLPKWPSSNVSLTLKVEGIDDPVSTKALAAVALQLGDLILTAPPGMGKTTTLFQIAESVASSNGIPLFVGLGDWAAEGAGLLASILARAAFRGVGETALRAAATEGDVVLLLDGWNELDADARKRARIELERLKGELPRLALIIATRRQALDVPLSGKRVDLLPLSEAQQLAIATTLIGDAGPALLDRAWRATGVRDLVPIPLYLTVLLSLGAGQFPETREELLRRFVQAHETDAARAEELERVAKGHHRYLLGSLAMAATRTANTSVSIADARRTVSASISVLIEDGQLAAPLDPGNLITALVDNTMLVRSGDPPGIAFQHQQFQEWFASHEVASRMMAAESDPDACKALKAEILDLPAWEEPILFAVERMARSGQAEIAACAEAVIAAFDVDPMLAAEMIYRATDKVWGLVETRVMARVGRWHVPGDADRALRFMMASARPEFRDIVWPLITAADDQMSYRALRATPRIRPALFGPDAAWRIRALPATVRAVLVSELAMDGSVEALELATEVATGDPDLDVQIQAADSLSFRLADRQLSRLFGSAPDGVFDHMVAHGFDPPQGADEAIRARLEAARQRFAAKASPLDRLRAIAFDYVHDPDLDELRALVRTVDIKSIQDVSTSLIYHAFAIHPQAVVDGLVARLRDGGSFFFRAADLLAGSSLAIEDEALVAIILEGKQRDDRAEAAASVLGPVSAGRVLDIVIEIRKQQADRSKPYDNALSDRRQALETALAHVSALSLVEAVAQRSPKASAEDLGHFAAILARHNRDEGDRARPFTVEALDVARDLALNWAERLISQEASRHDIGEVAGLMARIPDPRFLDPLGRMLDNNLRRLRDARASAHASDWQNSVAAKEAQSPLTEMYRRAFAAIVDPRTTELMLAYLDDPDFGQMAAGVLAEQWLSAHRPVMETRFGGGPDFSRVRALRREWLDNPAASTVEADAILAAAGRIQDAGADGAARALAFATIAAPIPHGGHGALFRTLIDSAPIEARARLLLNLIRSGEPVAMEDLERGIDDLFAAAQTKRWMIDEGDGWRLRDWLILLPFAEDLSRLVPIVMAIPPQQRADDRLDGLFSGLVHSPSAGAEQALFALGASLPVRKRYHGWMSAAFKLDSEYALQELIDLTAVTMDMDVRESWNVTRDLAIGLEAHPHVRARLYARLRGSEPTPGHIELALAVAQQPDVDGILLLVDLERTWRKRLIDFRALEGLVTGRVPLPEYSNSYSVVPVASPELRCRLLHETTDGGPNDPAAAALEYIDHLRDEHGRAIEEPRHPDLGSRKPWPILARDVEGEVFPT
ncbi:NACHT domain-containing protein [Sphingomonas kyeonggiensis]|uniref:NACHT C-terminal Alpha/Beta 2 domain-containing protein n=1 Tax=Sphingomonas kyeonggiensis TaxID=1268553 RepID=A0A7W6NWG5_9SPHN|nr:hypothetical protein [Sphingomonas kyeonggiensis]MBB4097464.1 hypothetical protein [Sphingomonas kyeonggiensis]